MARNPITGVPLSESLSSSASLTSATLTDTTTSASSTTTTTSTSTTTSSSSTTTTTSTSTTTSISTSSTTSSTSTSISVSVTAPTTISTTSIQPLSISTVIVLPPQKSSTSTLFVTSPPTPTPSRTVAPVVTKNNGFFANTGAVAGVFTIVGLIGLGVLIFLVTAFIRRRRAKRYDDDTAEAAMEAAATSHSAGFDDYGAYGAGPSAYTGYSAESHGTFGQPAIGHGGPGMGEAYPMHDVGGGAGTGGAYPTGYDTGYEPSLTRGVGAGAAGIGAAAGAAAMQRARSRRDPGATPELGHGGPVAGDPYGYDERTPYPAFAGPGGAPPQTMHDQLQESGLRARRPGGSSQDHDLLEAAGLGAGGALAGGAAAAYVQRQPSSRTQNTQTSGNKSMGSFGPVADNLAGYTNPSPPHNISPSETYASHYQPGFNSGDHQPVAPPAFSDGHGSQDNARAGDPFRRNTMQQPQPASPGMPNPYDDAYGGYADEPHGYPGSEEGAHYPRSSDEDQMSLQDEEDYGRQQRVLRVANE